MSRRALQVYASAVSVALFALVIWLAFHFAQEHRRDLAMAVRLRNAEELRRHNLDRLHRETAEVERLSQALTQARTVLAQAADGTNPFEDAVGTWLDQVNRMSAYLGQHPEYGIPELRYLTASDWLDATKGVNLVTEADYRRALANLRTNAKRIVAPQLADALRACLAANDGALPSDTAALAAYLPAGLDPSILQRYAMNPSGQVKYLRGDVKFVLVETKAVDPLWDSQWYLGVNGTGYHGADVMTANAVANAIDQFARSSGSLPTTMSQIEPYLTQKISPTRLAEIFSALTTKPNLPASGGGGP